MAKSNFIVRGGADFSGLKKGIDQTQKQLASFQASVNRSMKAAGAVLSSLAVGKFVKDSTSMAMGVEGDVENIGRNMASASTAFNHWAQTQSKAWGMARADAYKYGSTFSNLLASFSGSAKEAAGNTQELMQATAIIASKTGRSYEDTANRIRSGMLGSTEAIEDLGVYTNISMIESTAAFKKFANGKSWSQLSFQVQQQIRLAAVLEQTYARYGTTLADNTQTRQAKFIASLKNIQLNIGQAFLPIYNAVLPVLTAFGNKLDAITAKIKYFTQAIFGKVIAGPVTQTEDQAEAIAGVGAAAEKTGEKTKKAAKDMKGSLAGFDELSTLADKNGVSSGEDVSGAGAVPLDMSLDSSLGDSAEAINNFEKSVQRMKEAIAGIKEYIKAFIAPSMKEALDRIKPEVERFKSILGAVWSDLGKLGSPLKKWFVADFTPFLQTVIKTIGDIVAGLFNTFNTVFSDIWNIVFYPILENFIIVGLPLLTDFATKAVEVLGILFEQVKRIFDKIWSEGIAPVLGILTGIWTDTMNSISAAWKKHGEPIFEQIKIAIRNLGDLLTTVWDVALKPIWDTFMETIDWLWEKHLKPLLDNFLDFVSEFIDGALRIINEFVIPVVKSFVEKFGPPIAMVFGAVVSIIGTFLAVVADVVSGVITTIKGIVQFLTGIFTGDWTKAWEGIVNIFKGVFQGILGIAKGIVNSVIDIINAMIGAISVGINSIIDKINSISWDVPEWVPGIGGETWGFNIPKIQAPKIPKLAKGGITNGPMMALIGDNPGGREVVSPLDDLMGMLQEAVSGAMGQSSDNITIESPVYLDSKEIYRGQKKIEWQRGKSLISGVRP